MSFGNGATNNTLAGSADVALNNPAASQAVVFDTITGKWKNQVIVNSIAGKTGSVSLAEADIANLVSDLAGKVQTTGGGLEAVQTISNSGTSQTINLANGNMAVITLTANCTLSMSGATNGKACSLTLMLIQDGTGSRTVTWPGSIHWPASTVPTLTTTANKTDFIGLLSVDGGSNWYGFVSGQNY